MRSSVVIFVIFLFLLLGFWLARRMGFERASKLPSTLLQLQEHFQSQGVEVQPRLVKNIFSDIQFHAHLKVLGEEGRVFFILAAKSPEAAQAHLARLQRAPSKALPEINDQLVIILTDWDESAQLTQKVLSAFRSFKR